MNYSKIKQILKIQRFGKGDKYWCVVWSGFYYTFCWVFTFDTFDKFVYYVIWIILLFGSDWLKFRKIKFYEAVDTECASVRNNTFGVWIFM